MDIHFSTQFIFYGRVSFVSWEGTTAKHWTQRWFALNVTFCAAKVAYGNFGKTLSGPVYIYMGVPYMEQLIFTHTR